MGVPTSEVGYTAAMPRREDHEVHKDVGALGIGGGDNIEKTLPLQSPQNGWPVSSVYDPTT